MCLSDFNDLKSGNYRAVNKFVLVVQISPDSKKAPTPEGSRLFVFNIRSYTDRVPIGELVCGTYPTQFLLLQ
jgi:hypothetical protein